MTAYLLNTAIPSPDITENKKGHYTVFHQLGEDDDSGLRKLIRLNF